MVALSTQHPHPAVPAAAAPAPAPSRLGAPPLLPDGIDKATADRVLDLFFSAQEVAITDMADRVNADDLAGADRRGITPAARPLTVSAVAAILESPYAQQLFTTIRRLAEQRARIVAAEIRTEALSITRRIAANASSDETARRAANALLHFRTIAPRRPRTRPPVPPNQPVTNPDTPADEPSRSSTQPHHSLAAAASTTRASAASSGSEGPTTTNQPAPLTPLPPSVSHPASRVRSTKPSAAPPAQSSQTNLAMPTPNTRARDAPPSV